MQPLRRELLQSAPGVLRGHSSRNTSTTRPCGPAWPPPSSESERSAASSASAEQAKDILRAGPGPVRAAGGGESRRTRAGERPGRVPVPARTLRRGDRDLAAAGPARRARFQRELADAYNGLGHRQRSRPTESRSSTLIRNRWRSARCSSGSIRTIPSHAGTSAGSLNNLGVPPGRDWPTRAGVAALSARGRAGPRRRSPMAPHDLTIGRFLTTGLDNCTRLEEQLGRPEEAVRLERRGSSRLEDDGAGQSGHPLDTDPPGECLSRPRGQIFAPGAMPMRPGRRFAWRGRRSSGSLATVPMT